MTDTPIMVAFGANEGDARQTFKSAAEALCGPFREIRCASFYETVPHYDKPGAVEPTLPAPSYINTVFCARTALGAHEALSLLLETERRFGRIRPAPECAPRPIDLDLLLYGTLIENNDALVLPHPRMHLRNFVLVPANEIAPNWRHPLLDKTIAELGASCADPLAIRRMK